MFMNEMTAENQPKIGVRNPMEGLFLKTFDKPSDLLCCAFALRSSEIDTYFSIVTEPKVVEDIAQDIGKDRSTVQRILKKLHKKGLVIREVRNFERGGYYYVYSAISTDTVREQILEQLEQWYTKTKTFLLSSWPERPEHF
jgi:predicted transcriptional regulator